MAGRAKWKQVQADSSRKPTCKGRSDRKRKEQGGQKGNMSRQELGIPDRSSQE
jgi:hypothetical protein